jgi:two-component system response regulator HydG
MEANARPEPKPSVLVVDDERLNLDTFARVFRHDYLMVMADSAAEARERLAERPFDVVLSDFSMPEESGVDLLEFVRDAYPDTQRYLVTAYADLPEVRAAKSRGVVAAIIIKPWQRDEIARWVEHGKKLADMRRGVSAMKSIAPNKNEE